MILDMCLLGRVDEVWELCLTGLRLWNKEAAFFF